MIDTGSQHDVLRAAAAASANLAAAFFGRCRAVRALAATAGIPTTGSMPLSAIRFPCRATYSQLVRGRRRCNGRPSAAFRFFFAWRVMTRRRRPLGLSARCRGASWQNLTTSQINHNGRAQPNQPIKLIPHHALVQRQLRPCRPGPRGRCARRPLRRDARAAPRRRR